MNKSSNRAILIIASAVAFICLPISGPALADDVKNSINEALEFYEEGDYSGAVESLNYASQLIQQKKSENLSSFLPEPLDGWSAEDASSQAVGAAMFGGGVTAKREYTKDSGRISVEIVTDSPMLQGMMMMFSNPMFASSEGAKLERIKRQKAMVKYDAESEQGDIQLVVANRFLVTVEGYGVKVEDLKSYAEAIDYKKLETL